jgi:transposase
MTVPLEIEDEEHEQVLERVAAAGVAKAPGMVCTRVPHPSRPGRRLTRVWEAGATAGAVVELAEQLAGEGTEMVTLEATLVIWGFQDRQRCLRRSSRRRCVCHRSSDNRARTHARGS